MRMEGWDMDEIQYEAAGLRRYIRRVNNRMYPNQRLENTPYLSTLFHGTGGPGRIQMYLGLTRKTAVFAGIRSREHCDAGLVLGKSAQTSPSLESARHTHWKAGNEQSLSLSSTTIRTHGNVINIPLIKLHFGHRALLHKQGRS